MSDRGALVPHGIGRHARDLLSACAVRITTPSSDDQREVPDEDWLSDVITDSIDIDWTGSVGAKAIIRAMDKEGFVFARKRAAS